MDHASSQEVCFKYFEDSVDAAKESVVYLASVERCHILNVAFANHAAGATTEAAQHLWYEPYQPTTPASIRCAADDAPGTCALDLTDQLHPKSWLAAGTGSTPAYAIENGVTLREASTPTLTIIAGEDNGVPTTRSLGDKHGLWDCQLHQNDEHKATEPAPAE